MYLTSYLNKAVWILLAALVGLQVGCKKKTVENPGLELARYGDQSLYEGEIRAFLPPNLSVVDSEAYAKQYIQRWIGYRAMEEKAQAEIDKLDEQIYYKLEDSRNKLIEHLWSEWLIETELDTAVTPDAIQNYYTKYGERFQSDAPLYCFFFVKTNSSNRNQIAPWMKSNFPTDLEQLIGWSKANAIESRLDSSYVSDTEIERIGKGFYGDIRKVKKNVVHTYSYKENGETHYCFFKLIDKLSSGDQLPLVACKMRIKSLILNQRKLRLIRESEEGLIQQAKEQEKYSTY